LVASWLWGWLLYELPFIPPDYDDCWEFPSKALGKKIKRKREEKRKKKEGQIIRAGISWWGRFVDLTFYNNIDKFLLEAGFFSIV
jgi:hypothetical protein